MRLFSGTEFDIPPQCDRCQQLENECSCEPIETTRELKAPDRQTARVALEKRKKGKWVTVVRGLAADENDLSELCTRLKNSCGAGGTVNGDTVEIQGDQVQRVKTALKQIGYRINQKGKG